MKWWYMGFTLIIFLFMVVLFVVIYNYAGLKQYKLALVKIDNLPSEQKVKARNEFYGTDARGAKRGILAGSWFGRIWIWSVGGFKSYATDEYTVYSYFDGCNQETKEKLNKGEKNAIKTLIDVDISDWRKKAKIGDYVVVYTAQSENGGTKGNMREIYTYNFWMFLHTGIDLECAR